MPPAVEAGHMSCEVLAVLCRVVTSLPTSEACVQGP